MSSKDSLSKTAEGFLFHSACLTFDSKAASIQSSTLGGGDIHFQTQLFQRPAVCLGHILAGCSNVSLWHKQAAQANMDVLEKGRQKEKR